MFQPFHLHFCICRWALSVCAEHELFVPTAGTISGEELPIMSKTNIKEYRDSFSCERFTFRSNPNITFYVYVSNFSWPIKIQVRTVYDLGLTRMKLKTHKGIWSLLCSVLSLCFILLTDNTECVASSMTFDWWTVGPTYVNRAAIFLQMQSSIVAQGEFKCTLF